MPIYNELPARTWPFTGNVTKCGDTISMDYNQNGTLTIPRGYHFGAMFIRQQSSNVATTDGDCLLTITPINCICTQTAYHRGPNNSTNAGNINEQCLMYLVYIPGGNGASIALQNRGTGNYNSSGAEIGVFNEND